MVWLARLESTESVLTSQSHKYGSSRSRSHAYGCEECSPAARSQRPAARNARLFPERNTPALATSTSTSRQPSFSPAANKRPTDIPRTTLANKCPTHATIRTGHPQHLRTCAICHHRGRPSSFSNAAVHGGGSSFQPYDAARPSPDPDQRY